MRRIRRFGDVEMVVDVPQQVMVRALLDKRLTRGEQMV
jgi:hypothetical protein